MSNTRLAVITRYLEVFKRSKIIAIFRWSFTYGSRFQMLLEFLSLFVLACSPTVANNREMSMNFSLNAVRICPKNSFLSSLQCHDSSTPGCPSPACSRSTNCSSSSCQTNTSALYASASEHGCIPICQSISSVQGQKPKLPITKETGRMPRTSACRVQ
jgi:hypothetical protein